MTAAPDPAALAPYLAAWGLVPDGAPIVTAVARLLPVRRAGVPAMLKLSRAEEEPAANALMAWWAGEVPRACWRATAAPCCWSGPPAGPRWP